MNWQKGVAEALQKGTCFSQGNYMVVFKKLNADSCKSSVFYYGHKVFEYKRYKYDSEHKYHFCGYEGHSRTTKLICCCLEAIGEKYRVKTVKGKVVEVPVTAKTSRYN